MDLLNRPRIVEHAHKSVNYTIFDVKWIPQSARFVSFGASSSGRGVFQIYSFGYDDTGKGGKSSGPMKLKPTKRVEQGARIRCGAFGFSPSPSRLMATGSMNGKLSLWDIDKCDVPIQTYEAHNSVIHTIDTCGVNTGPPEIVTGSMDGCVRVWDSRQKGKCVAALEPAGEKQECWAVGFGNSFDDENRVVACGYANGDLKFFDLKTNKLQWETNVKSGVIKVEFCQKERKMDKLLVTCLEGKVFVFDLKTFNESSGYAFKQHVHKDKTTVWSGTHLPQNPNVFATGHGNGEFYLWKYVFPKQRWIGEKGSEECRGYPGKIELISDTTLSTQPLCAIDWNKQKTGLAVVGAFDQKLRTIFLTKTSEVINS